jgi:hypothetical protein
MRPLDQLDPQDLVWTILTGRRMSDEIRRERERDGLSGDDYMTRFIEEQEARGRQALDLLRPLIPVGSQRFFHAERYGSFLRIHATEDGLTIEEIEPESLHNLRYPSTDVDAEHVLAFRPAEAVTACDPRD